MLTGIPPGDRALLIFAAIFAIVFIVLIICMTIIRVREIEYEGDEATSPGSGSPGPGE
jgi:preprotein translocase subunit SecG